MGKKKVELRSTQKRGTTSPCGGRWRVYPVRSDHTPPPWKATHQSHHWLPSSEEPPPAYPRHLQGKRPHPLLRRQAGGTPLAGAQGSALGELPQARPWGGVETEETQAPGPLMPLVAGGTLAQWQVLGTLVSPVAHRFPATGPHAPVLAPLVLLPLAVMLPVHPGSWWLLVPGLQALGGKGGGAVGAPQVLLGRVLLRGFQGGLQHQQCSKGNRDSNNMSNSTRRIHSESMRESVRSSICIALLCECSDNHGTVQSKGSHSNRREEGVAPPFRCF